MNKFLAGLIIANVAVGGVAAANQTAGRYVPDAELVGKARFKYLTFNVFDAELYAPRGDLRHNRPYLLAITYLHAFTGEQIAGSAVEQIRRQGCRNEDRLADWKERLAEILPDVEKGDRISGFRDGGTVRFFKDGRELGAVTDAEFAEQFFGVWIGDRA